MSEPWFGFLIGWCLGWSLGIAWTLWSFWKPIQRGYDKRDKSPQKFQRQRVVFLPANPWLRAGIISILSRVRPNLERPTGTDYGVWLEAWRRWGTKTIEELEKLLAEDDVNKENDGA